MDDYEDDYEEMIEKSKQIIARSKIPHVWLLEYKAVRGGTVWSMVFWEFEDAQRTAQLDVGPIEWGPDPIDEDCFIGRLPITADYWFHLTKMRIY